MKLATATFLYFLDFNKYHWWGLRSEPKRLIKFDLIILWTLKPIYQQHTILSINSMLQIINGYYKSQDSVSPVNKIIILIRDVPLYYHHCRVNNRAKHLKDSKCHSILDLKVGPWIFWLLLVSKKPKFFWDFLW